MAFKDKTKNPFIEDRDTNVFIGIDLPFRKSDGPDGWFASTTTTIEAVKNNIRNFLQTELGDRLFQPQLGIGLRKYIFEPITPDTLIIIQDDILDRFNVWMPFVEIRDIKVKSGDSNSEENIGKNQISIIIDFNIKQDPNTLTSVQVNLVE